MSEVSDPEQRAGYQSITYPYRGNAGIIRAIKEWERSCREHGCESLEGAGHEITILRVHQGWYGVTIVYRKGDGNP
jgi:hypothetical protein